MRDFCVEECQLPIADETCASHNIKNHHLLNRTIDQHPSLHAASHFVLFSVTAVNVILKLQPLSSAENICRHSQRKFGVRFSWLTQNFRRFFFQYPKPMLPFYRINCFEILNVPFRNLGGSKNEGTWLLLFFPWFLEWSHASQFFSSQGVCPRVHVLCCVV